MFVHCYVAAFVLLASGVDKPFPSGIPVILEIRHNTLNGSSASVHVNKAARQKIAAALAGGNSEIGKFFADYTIFIFYDHKRERVLVNGKYFKYRSQTYVMADNISDMLTHGSTGGLSLIHI